MTETPTHALKCWPTYFQAIKSGSKNFEVRRDDRGFQKGDRLRIQEWEPAKNYHPARYTGAELSARITYVLTGGQFGIEPGYVVMGLALEGSHDK